VTHPYLCSCAQPNPKKIATHIKNNETDPVTLDLSVAGLSPDLFPLDKFAPVAMLGDSPRATVILCRDRQRGTKVAVKCFKTIAPSLFPTFEGDVRKNKQLTHTNIAKIVDSGIHNGKTPYLVTEYKDGFNLEQCLDLYGFPSPDVAIDILLGACEALSYGQTQSVLHRDIRPGNIIFLDDLNSQPSICVTDFALPKVKAAEQLTDPWLSLYMSAEEARNMEYSEKSEVYSLGCVGYSILTGRPPFQEGTALDIKNSHALKLPPRMNRVNFDKNRPSEIDEVIEKCLEKDPRERYESIAKFQERLAVFPRRIQMRIAAFAAARKRAKILRYAVVGLAVVAVCAAGFFAFAHH
jgi:serine/threonine-protein kinase